MPSASQPAVRIGARGSKLSVVQASWVQRQIAANLGASQDEVDTVAPLIRITTTGDRVQDRRLLEIGGKGLFTKEIEEALLDGRIDCAVHSLKDMPAEQPPGLVIGAIPEREDSRDVFISDKGATLMDLPKGALLGTASLRRQAQALHRRPDLQLLNLRGNVDTRLAKLKAGEADAIILAMAGLNRLGLHGLGTPLDPVEQPPAPGQGALAIQVRAEDAQAPWLTALIHRPTLIAIAAERGALAVLEGSCKTAIGAHAQLRGETLFLIAEALTPDGSRRFRHEGEADIGTDGEAAARSLGERLGEAVRAEGGAALAL
ncbi:MAG TPA: hydroxymethylbilane synthase [Caulobacteraceae bacterium]